MAILNHQTGSRGWVTEPFLAGKGRGRRWWIFALIAGLMLQTPRTLVAQAAAPAEYELKAAFLYNFLLFVEWPADAFPSTNSPIRIGIVGGDPFGATLDQTMKGKTVGGRQVVIQRVKDPRDETNCHLLFIGRAEKRPLGQLLTRVGKASVLTVSDLENFPESGGIIALTMDGKKVRFEVNLEAAEYSRLKIDPKLLKLAKVVRNPSSVPRN